MRKVLSKLREYISLTHGQRVGLVVLTFIMSGIILLKWMERPVRIDFTAAHKQAVEKFATELANPTVEVVYRKSDKKKTKTIKKQREVTNEERQMQPVPIIED